MDYFLAGLAARIIAPFARSFIGILLGVAAFAFVLRAPAELWKRYVDARPSQTTLEAITLAWLAIIVAGAAWLWITRWRERREIRALRREMIADLRSRRMARR